MNIAINIGNSNIKIALSSKSNEYVIKQIPIKANNIANDIKSILLEVNDSINQCIISSVNPGLSDIVYTLASQYCQNEPILVIQDLDFQLDYSLYDGLLGIDRIVCCEAAHQQISTPFIMIDLGTATTINVVSDNNQFIGGMILTGVQMGLDALADKTALLPLTLLDFKTPLIGSNTKEGLLSGAIYGTAYQLDNIISKIWEQLGIIGQVVITGGHAPFILPHLHTSHIHEPNLIIKGLFSILKQKNF